MLPKSLDSIQTIADDCLVLATSVEKKFIDVMDLVGELLEACTNAKGHYDEELEKTKVAIEVLNESKKSVEQRQKEIEKKKKETMNEMENAEREFKDAMEQVPSTGDLLGLAVADAFIGVVKNITNLIPGSSEKSGRVSKPVGATSRSSPTKPESSLNDLIVLVGEIQAQTAFIEDLAFGDKSEGNGRPQWDMINKGAEKAKQKFKGLLKKLPRTASPQIDENLKKLCTDAMDICETLLSLRKAFKKDEANVDAVMSKVEKLRKDVETASLGLSMANGGNSLSNKSPHQATQQVENDESLMKSALQSARFKTEMAKQNLTDSRKRYDQSCQEFDTRMKEMGEILADLAKQNPKKLNLEEITATLVKGMKALGQLREEWGKLVQFFTMLSNLVKCCLVTSLKQFVETSKVQKELSGQMSDTMRDVLFEEAFKANQIAYVVNTISATYTEVSQKYLMGRITSLGSLISLDPASATDLPIIMEKKAELTQGCEEAQESIKAIAKRKQKDIAEALDNRIGRIKFEVEAVMPAMEKAEMKEIEDQVKTAKGIQKAALQMQDIDDLV
jgi:hypothetical protein